MVPDRLGDRYRILSSLRTTPVYREVVARDERRTADVKLWLINPALADDAGVKGRFLAGVQSWLDAPVRGGLRLQAGGVIGGTVYLRVPPGRLECLRTRLLRWRPSVDDVTHVVSVLVGTMKAAHERCWVHGLLTARDLLFTAEGAVVVAGIGLWQQLARRPMLAALGHEGHSLAPEVRSGEIVGVAADMYSVAAVAAELLQSATGATTAALRRRSWHPLLIEAVERLLAAGPAERPGSFSALATSLEVRTPAPVALPDEAAPLGSAPLPALVTVKRDVSVIARRPLPPPPPAPGSMRAPSIARPTDRTSPDVSMPPPPARMPRASTAPAPRPARPGSFAVPSLPPPLPPPPTAPPVLPWIDEASDSDVPTLQRRAARRPLSPAASVSAHPRLLRRR